MARATSPISIKERERERKKEREREKERKKERKENAQIQYLSEALYKIFLKQLHSKKQFEMVHSRVLQSRKFVQNLGELTTPLFFHKNIQTYT